MKNLKMKSYILILLLVTSSTLVAQLNTLRENELIFSNGVEFEDTIHQALGSKVPNDVCNQAVVSPKCEQAYGTFWQAYAANGGTIGTLNVTLERAQGLEEDFKIILSEIAGTEIGSQESDLSGFNTAPYSSNQFEYSTDGSSPANIGKERGSFSYLQAGISIFGPSIWVRNDVDSNEVAINAYRAVDWALNPAGPESLGFNIFEKDGTFSKEVLIGDYFEVNPEKTAVRIHQESSTECDNFSNGLCIEGDASVGSVIGKIGLIGSHVATAQKDFRTFTNNGSAASFTSGTKRAFYFQNVELNTKAGIVQGDAVDYMVAYIGFISIVNMEENDALQYWMIVAPAGSEVGQSMYRSEAECANDYPGLSTQTGLGGGSGEIYQTYDSDGTKDYVLYSTKGEFDYQRGANSEASFQFVVIENIKGYYDKTIKRDIVICWDWASTADGDNSDSSGSTTPVTAGYLIYGLPTGQSYNF